MKCSNCLKIITTYRDCIFCGKKCCCFICLEDHYLSAHKNNKSTKDKNTKQIDNNKENEEENKISPYLVTGIINRKIKYHSKYNLENFTPIMEKDEIKSIGSGSFGQVYLALNTLDNKVYAIKHMDKKKLIKILHSLKGIYQEIDIQSRIDHPNIVKILYTDEDEDSFDLVMEYADNGSLFHFIRKNKGLNEFKTFQLFIQVVNAINFLHENDLIHRDIKPENILLFSNKNKTNGNSCDYIIKLCDFGWCVKLNGQERDTFCGTTEYMSPELVNHKEYSKEIDVWSLGILLYEMIHGYSPFRPNKPKFNEKDVFNNIKKHKLKFKKKISNECKGLIYHLLAFDKDRRYKVEDIYKSKFVKYFEKINYCLPKRLSNIKNKEKEEEKEEEEEENIYQIHEIKTNNNNNNFIYREVNDNDEEKENNNKNKNQIKEVYNELKELNSNNLRKILTNNSVDNKIIKSLSKNMNMENITKLSGIRKKYHLNLINYRNEKNNSISFINNNININNLNKMINLKRITNKSEDNLHNKNKVKRNYSLQNNFNYCYKYPDAIYDKKIRKNRTVSKEVNAYRKGNKKYFNKKLSNINAENKNNSYASNKTENNNNLIKIINNKKNKINSIIINNTSKNNKNKANQNLINKNENILNKNENKYNIQKINKDIIYNTNLNPFDERMHINSELYNYKKNNFTSNYNINHKNLSQRIKTNSISTTTNNSISNKIKKDNNKEIKNYNNLIKNKTINKEKILEINKIIKKQNVNEYSEIKYLKDNSSNLNLKKINSVCNIKKKKSNICKGSTSNLYETSNNNNENINNDTIKLELSPQNLIQKKMQKDLDNLKKKSKTNFNFRKSPNLNYYQNSKIINSPSSYERKIKENKKNIFKINIMNRRKKLSNNKKVSSISPKHINNINSYRERTLSKNVIKARFSKMNYSKNKKRKINSVNNKNNNRIKIYPKILYSNKNKEIINNNSDTNNLNINRKNINILNKNLFNEQENEISRIQSDRILINHKDNAKHNNKDYAKNNILPTKNFIFLKSQKIDNNKNNKKIIKEIKNISPDKYLNLLRNNTTQNIKKVSLVQKINFENYPQSQQKKITNIKLQNKKSFCFVSRNNKQSGNKYENIFCGPINKINNINYQSNNINNFYIINNNMNNTGTNINQQIFKKQFTEKQKQFKKNIDDSKLVLPISLLENRCINYTFNKGKNINANKDLNYTKSSSRKKAKLNLKYYLMRVEKKRVNSYNNKRIEKKKEISNSKDSDSNIIYGDSDFDDEGERNQTPIKNKDNMKINPIKLLGDFKKEYTIFNKHNKNLSESSGLKL